MSLENQSAKNFELPGSDGARHKLADYAGEWLVLYFYPKDNTPGCTQEACDFRDSMEHLVYSGARVVGVSRDSIERHEAFIRKHDLDFLLLSDESLEVHKAYEAWGEKKMYGKTREGVIRSTFIIDPKGIIRKQWRNLRVKGHVDRVLETLMSLKSE